MACGLQAHPKALGLAPYNASSALPYLFKVLSVAKALSVQAHPDRALAAKLHATAPQHYKDDNHKPEMTCALTPFEAMCAFRSPSDLAAHISGVPELVQLVGAEKVSSFQRAVASAATDKDESINTALKEVYAAYMAAPDAAVQTAVAALESRLRSAGVDSNSGAAPVEGGRFAAPPADAVALRLCRQFPGDIGAFAPYFLNVIALAPGEAVFLPANEPHAYLSGDCMEVMAASDNVVRAGLTPKFKDVPTLVQMLTYNTGLPEVQRGAPASFDPSGCTVVYTAPVPEFVLYKTSMPPAAPSTEVTLHGPPSAAIIVVLKGHGKAVLHDGGSMDLSEGHVWLQGAGQVVTVTRGGAEELLFFRTHANA